MKMLGLFTEISTTKSVVRLQEINAQIIKFWSDGSLPDEEAETILQASHDRKHELRDSKTSAPGMLSKALPPKASNGSSYFPPKRKVLYTRDREASLARRRVNAASGPMPPRLAAKFTTGELSVLNIIADEARTCGSCQKTLGEISARAGVCITTARNAIRYAAAAGLVSVQERRRYRQPNLANVIKIISTEWLSWLDTNRRKSASFRGCKKLESTDTSYNKYPKKGQLRVTRLTLLNKNMSENAQTHKPNEGPRCKRTAEG